MVEVNTILKFEDKNETKHKSHFEMNYATILKIDDTVSEKKELEKLFLLKMNSYQQQFRRKPKREYLLEA